MFNPQLAFEPNKMWDRMASIYAYLTPEDKAEMELMWEAMFEALSALYYNLSQSTMSMMLGRSRGYFESSHQEIPLYLSGQTKTIKPDFMLNEDVISQVCHFNSQLYLLTEQAVYTSSDDKFLEEYGTNDNIDTLTRLVYTGGQKYLIGLSGVYAYETDTWNLVWGQNDVQNVTQLGSNQYFIRKTASVGITHHLLPAENYYPQEANLPSSGITYLSDYKTASGLYLGSDGATYQTDPSTLSWATAGTITGVRDFELFDTKIYALTTSGIYSSSEASITWAEELLPTTYYLKSDNSLYTGSATSTGTEYILTTDGEVWTGSVHQDTGQWYTEASHTANSILLTAVSTYETASGEALLQNTEQFHSLTSKSDKIYAASERQIYESADGSTWAPLYSSVPTMLTDIFSSASVSGVYAGTHRGALHISNTGTKTDIISGYNYCDIDNSGFYYLSIPSLTSVLTDTILTEGIDYEIVNFDKLKFLKDLTLKDSGESFYMISGICLLPSIYNLYFQGFGEPNPKNLLQNDIIVPYISGFHTISDHHQKSKIWANHLLQFCWAATSTLRTKPTLAAIKHGYELMRGLPFSYYDSEYDSDWTTSGVNYLKTTISGLSSSIVYEVKEPAKWNTYTAGEVIPKFSVLVSGIKANDFRSDLSVITSLVADTTNPEEKYHIIGINESNRLQDLKYSQNMLNAYTANTIPATFFRVLYNKPPTVIATVSGTQFYNGASSATIQALTSDPEMDILTYRWNFLGPYNNHAVNQHYIPVISGLETTTAIIDLPTPLVDSKLTFEITVDDTFNNVKKTVDIYVSGTHQFDSWGDTDFVFGDLNVGFDVITIMNQG